VKRSARFCYLVREGSGGLQIPLINFWASSASFDRLAPVGDGLRRRRLRILHRLDHGRLLQTDVRGEIDGNPCARIEFDGGFLELFAVRSRWEGMMSSSVFFEIAVVSASLLRSSSRWLVGCYLDHLLPDAGDGCDGQGHPRVGLMREAAIADKDLRAFLRSVDALFASAEPRPPAPSFFAAVAFPFL